MTKNYIIDTNVIIRYLIKDDAKLFEEANHIFEQIKKGAIRVFLEQTVFTEVVFVLSSFYEVPRDIIADTLNNMLKYKGFVTHEIPIFIDSLSFFKTTNLHIVDCVLCAKTQLYKLELITFDKKLKSIDCCKK